MSHNLSSLLAESLILASAAIMLVASLHDIIARTVPDSLATALALLGVALRILNGDLPGGLLAGLLVFVAAAICWRRGWLGGADVKLLAAAAIVVPPAAAISFIAAVGLCGGVLAMFYLIARSFISPPTAARPASLPARALRVERWRIARGGPLPYACAIAAGGLFILL